MSSLPPGQDHSALRALFNGDASAYDANRPGYPDPLIADILSLSQLPPTGRILEVGCGTGQATFPFARRGYSLLCLDIGEEMLKLARQKFQAFPQVAFWHGAFEDWPLEADAFDLFISATAFHWVPRDIAYPKAARVLKPGGTLAIFSNEHSPHGRFFEEVQAVYERCRPELRGRDPRYRPDLDEKISELADYIDATALFAPVTVRTYPWQQTYTTAEYLSLLNTYSDNLAMQPHQRAQLFAGIADLIDTRFGGQVTKNYLAVLYLAKKL